MTRANLAEETKTPFLRSRIRRSSRRLTKSMHPTSAANEAPKHGDTHSAPADAAADHDIIVAAEMIRLKEVEAYEKSCMEACLKLPASADRVAIHRANLSSVRRQITSLKPAKVQVPVLTEAIKNITEKGIKLEKSLLQ